MLSDKQKEGAEGGTQKEGGNERNQDVLSDPIHVSHTITDKSEIYFMSTGPDCVL